MANDKYIVYTWWNQSWEPYYVGLSAGGQRQNRHRQSHAEQNIPQPPSKKHITVIECSSIVEMYGTEIALIEFYGRKIDGGTLLNRSTGGHNGRNGILHTPEYRKIMRQRTLARYKRTGHPQQGRRGSSCHNSLTYAVTSPTGDTFVVTGLTQFCKDNDLNPTTMVRVSKGKQKQTKGGWTCVRTDPP